MIVFVAGATGYLGNHLFESLFDKYDVYGIVRSSSIEKISTSMREKIICSDSYSELEKAFQIKKPDVVINTAALYGRKGEHLSSLVEANIEFPVKLYELSMKYGVKGFIQTGTSLPDATSFYSYTKNTFSNLVKSFHNDEMAFIDVQLEHFYGPNEEPSKFTSYVIEKCSKGEDIDLTEGTQQRDFIYIADVVEAYKVLLKNISNIQGYQSIDVGSGKAIRVRDFVELIHQLSGSFSNLNFGMMSMRSNEVMYSCADISKMNSFGWSPKMSLQNGISLVLKRKSL